MGRKRSLGNNGFIAHKDNVELQSSVFSTATQSTIEAGASRSGSFSEGTITRRQKDAEVSTNSSEGTRLTCQSSVLRVVSSECALPLKEEMIYPDGGRVEQDQLVDDIQSNAKLITEVSYTEKRLVSESSSSNSSHAIAANHSDSMSQWEISVEARPCKEGMMTGVIHNHKALGCSSLTDEKSNETVKSSSVGSSLKNSELAKEIGKQVKSCGQATSDTSQLSEQLCLEKTKRTESISPETGNQSKEAAHEEQQLSKLQDGNCQAPNLCGFDLNEDLVVNEAVHTKHPIDEAVASHHAANISDPIAVVAKIGVPNGIPTAPLPFDGELGWRRAAATSAFRPALPSKNTTTSTGLRGFDLNVAVSVDGTALDSDPTAPPSEPHAIRSSLGIGSRESVGLTLDLNCQGASHHAQKKPQVQSFDLNDDLLIDQDFRRPLHHPDQSSQPKRNCVPTDAMKGSARQSNVGGVRPAYWVDLSSMPGFTHVQGQPFLVAAPTLFSSVEQKQTLVPLQPNVAFTPAPPSYIGATNALSSSIYSPSILQHVSRPNGASTTLPQMPGPVLAAYPGSLHLMETAQGLAPRGYTNIRPSFFLNGGVGSMENASWVVNTQAEERMKASSQTVASPALADKRREPESGWDSYQLNHRRMTPWK